LNSDFEMGGGEKEREGLKEEEKERRRGWRES
jgi:hypothetical protein